MASFPNTVWLSRLNVALSPAVHCLTEAITGTGTGTGNQLSFELSSAVAK
jgi:hypothetical protein